VRDMLNSQPTALPSLFMPAWTHLRSRQARHWLRCVLSTMQLPSDLALQTYCLCLRMDRLKNPAQLRQVETIPLHLQVETTEAKQKQSTKRLVLTRRTRRSRNVSRTSGPDTLCKGCRIGFDLQEQDNSCFHIY
jgi:hypothetical protein